MKPKPIPNHSPAHRALALWAATCAAHVLRHFEAHRPHDPRPRRAINAARAFARGKLTVTAARAAAQAAHAAARSATDPAAIAAARAAGHAAAAAHVPTHARALPYYALKAAIAAASAKERHWQIHRLPQPLRRLIDL